MSIVAVSGNTYTITGSVAAFISGGFQMQGGRGVGYEHILTNSNTVFAGARPYKGENVEVVASGTLSTGTLTASKVTQISSASNTATPQPAAAPTSATMWHIGQSYVFPATSDGDYQHPTLINGGAGADFSMTRNYEGTNDYRNQMNPTIGGSVIRLTPGVTYDWKFQTVANMQPDANFSQNLIFQIHDYNAGTSPITVLGTQNINNGRTVWYFHSGSGTWTGTYTYGATDTWEIQVKISDSGAGVEKLYRNGALVSSQAGSNYSTSSQGNPWWNFGPYEWDWKSTHSTGQISNLNSLDFKFNYMIFGKI